MTFHSMCRSAALASACLLAASPVSAIPLFELTGGTARVGDALSVTARARDLVDLYGYQFSLVFDPTRVSFGGVAEGGFLATAGTTFFDGGTPDGAGRIDFVFDTLIGPVAGATGSGDLAVFRFVALQGGLAAFSLADVLAIDSRLAPIEIGTTAVVLAVPEPAVETMLLAGLVAALLAIGARPSRRRAVATNHA